MAANLPVWLGIVRSIVVEAAQSAGRTATTVSDAVREKQSLTETEIARIRSDVRAELEVELKIAFDDRIAIERSRAVHVANVRIAEIAAEKNRTDSENLSLKDRYKRSDELTRRLSTELSEVEEVKRISDARDRRIAELVRTNDEQRSSKVALLVESKKLEERLEHVLNATLHKDQRIAELEGTLEEQKSSMNTVLAQSMNLEAQLAREGKANLDHRDELVRLRQAKKRHDFEMERAERSSVKTADRLRNRWRKLYPSVGIAGDDIYARAAELSEEICLAAERELCRLEYMLDRVKYRENVNRDGANRLVRELDFHGDHRLYITLVDRMPVVRCIGDKKSQDADWRRILTDSSDFTFLTKR